MTELPQPSRISEPIWLEPYPDVLLDGIADDAPGPDARYEAKEATTLAFVAGLQHLPAQQRAVLVLRDVLGFRAAEVAEMLDTTRSRREQPAAPRPRGARAVACRLRGACAHRCPTPSREREVAGRFADAMEAGDIDTAVALLTDDAWLKMPPQPFEYQGPAVIGDFLKDRAVRRGAPLRLVPTRANGQPAFACYFPSPHTDIARPYGLVVLTLADERHR